MVRSGQPLGNRPTPPPPSGKPDNINRIAKNVRIDGYDTVHRGEQATLTPGCGAYAPDHKLILTTAYVTCRRPGCAS
jgi:hypothetical protein